MALTFNRVITVGDLITVISVMVTIVGSTITLSCSWSKDRQLARHEQANLVRTAAAATVAKLEHWRDISLSLFDAIQPALVQAGEDLAHDRSKSGVLEARDRLYKELYEARLSLQAAMRDEDIETYVYLYGYDSSIRQNTLTRIKKIENQMFESLLRVTEAKVLVYLSPEKKNDSSYTSASLGNALREVVAATEESFNKRLHGTLDPAVSVLISLVFKPDADLINRDVGGDESATTASTTAGRGGPATSAASAE